MPVTENEARQLVGQVEQWHHRFEIFPNVVTPGTYDPRFLWDLLRLPERLDGQRALDIGACDGYYTKRLSDAGASVVAVDYRAKQAAGFWVMERCSDYQFDYRHANVYELDSAELGRFDIVLF